MFDSDRAVLSGWASMLQELFKFGIYVAEQRKRELAYFLWERAGRPEGRSDEFWFEAGRHLDDINAIEFDG